MSDAIRILHVDDDPDFTELTAICLERENDRFNVVTAHDASAGLETIADNEFDCIVSDYDMPAMNGIDFLTAVREEYPDLPFLLFTGKGSEEVASDAISAGVTDYLQKGSGTDQYTVLSNRILNAVESYRSQQALTERNRKLRKYERMVNTMQEAACIYDADGRFDIVNDYLANWYGTTREAIEGEQSNLIPHVREQGETDQYAELLAGNRQEIHGELTGEFPGHGHAVLEYRLTPLTVDGDVEGVVGVARDITEHREREQELFRRKRAMDEAPAGITITDPEQPDNPIIYANARFQELTGYPSDETLGRNCRFLQGENTDPEPVATMREAIDNEERVTVELRNYQRDGTAFWNRVSIAPVYNDDGALVNYVGFQQNIDEQKQREQELARTRERMELALETTDAAVWEVDFQTGEASFYPSSQAHFGTDIDTFDDAIAQIHPADRESVRTAWETGKETGEYEAEFRIDDGDDGRWISSRGYVEYDPSGEPTRAIGVGQDITERKEREQELEHYQQHMERVMDAIDDVFFVHDKHGNLQDWNSALAEITGYSDEEIASMNGVEFVPEEHRERTAAAIERVFEAGHARLEAPLLTKNGETIPYEYTADRIDHPDGDPRLVGLGRDISERKERERQVREQRERLERRQEKLIRLRDYTQNLMYAETASETAGIALRAIKDILGFDLGAVFRQSDTQENLLELVEVLNRSRMEKMYGGLPAFVRGGPSGTHSALAWEVFETRESVFINDTSESDRLTRKSPFGSLILYPVEGHGVVLLAATQMDAFTETEELLLDLLATALKTAFDRLNREQDLRRQRDELERQNERLDEFVSVVSHDLRNPLHVASARLELATDECDSTHLDDVDMALDRMQTLIEDLRTLAREGESARDLEPVAVADLAKSCWRTVATEKASLVVETDQTVRADRNRLRQLLENLMRNAVEHGGDDVTITIGRREDGFYVADDGPGIPEDERTEVFESGFTTSEDGTGYGLTIVEDIADAHGWEVPITESEDGGARFELTQVDVIAE